MTPISYGGSQKNIPATVRQRPARGGHRSAIVSASEARPAQVASTHISDTILASKPFIGTGNENAEFWLEYFERYVAYRQLPENDARALFCMLTHGSASDFLTTLPNANQLSLAGLKQAFRQNYFRSAELRWKNASDLWNKPPTATGIGCRLRCENAKNSEKA